MGDNMSIEGVVLVFIGGIIVGFVGCAALVGSCDKDAEETRIWSRKKKFYRLVPLEPPQ